LPRRYERLYLGWKDKNMGVIAEIRPSKVVISSYNLTFMLEPNQVTIEGDIHSVDVIDTSKRRNAYVSYDDIKPVPLGRVYCNHFFTIFDRFKINVINHKIASYITIIVPGDWLYEFMVISDNKACISMSKGRKAYVEEYDKTFNIYIT